MPGPNPFAEFVRRAIDRLERGLGLARQTADTAASQLRDVARQAREAREQAKAAAQASRQGAKAPAGLSQLQERANALRGENLDRAATSAVNRALSVARRAANLGSGLATLATSDDQTGTKGLQLGLHALASAPIPIVKDVAAVVSQVVAYFDAQQRRRDADLARLVQERIDLAIARSDSSRRYEEDPRFRQEEDERARQVYIARRDGGWEPRSAAALEGW